MIRKPSFCSLLMSCGLLLSLSSSLSLLYSCSSLTIDEPSTEQQQSDLCEVTINLSGLDFIIETNDTPASRATAADAGVAGITLTAYNSEGRVAFTITQAATDEGFGTITTKIPVGTYTFVAVAHDSSDASAAISSTTEARYSGTMGFAVYSATKQVAVSGNTSQSVQMEMGKRITSSFGVKITDPTPAEVESVQIIISPSSVKPTAYTFNPATGFAADNWRYERTVSKTSSNVTTFTNKVLQGHLLLTSPEQQLNVQINVLDTQGNVLYTRSKEGITFRQATRTIATGTFFSASSSGSFDFDTADNTAINIPLD